MTSNDNGGTGGATTSSTSKTTPPRHNYHNPNTPIASIKRPRSSLIGRTSSNGASNDKSLETPRGGNAANKSDSMETPATPMSIVPDTNNETAMTNNMIPPHFTSPASRRRRPMTAESPLSPMHGVRPVTSRDIHDIPTIASSSLDDIDEGYEESAVTNASIEVDDHAKASSSSTWVGKKVDALFSPVYHFLHHEEQEQKIREQRHHLNDTNNSNDADRVSDGTSIRLEEPMDVSSTPEKGVGDESDDEDVNEDEEDGILTKHHNHLATYEAQPVSSSSPDSSGSNASDKQGASTTLPTTTSPSFVLSTAEKDANNSGNNECPSSSSFDVDIIDDEEIEDNHESGNSNTYNDSHDGLDAANHHHNNDGGDASDDDHSMGRPEHPTDMDEFNPWQFIKSLPEYNRIKHQAPPIALPPKSPNAPEKTLVLDLDETLVHCTVETPETPADLTFPVVFHGITYTVHVRLRPYLQTFLEKLHGKFEIIVFTASQKVYADELLNLIDPQRTFIQHRLFRESCLEIDRNYLKDLNVLGRDLSKTVLVDNSPHAFGYQVDNGIPIESWFDCPNDRELLKLERFLRTIQNVDDVRPSVRQKFQSYRLIQESASIYG